jgi:hypothetical protein
MALFLQNDFLAIVVLLRDLRWKLMSRGANFRCLLIGPILADQKYLTDGEALRGRDI